MTVINQALETIANIGLYEYKRWREGNLAVQNLLHTQAQSFIEQGSPEGLQSIAPALAKSGMDNKIIDALVMAAESQGINKNILKIRELKVPQPSGVAEAGGQIATPTAKEYVRTPEITDDQRNAKLYGLNDIFISKVRDNPDKAGTAEGNLTLWEDSLDEFYETNGFFPNKQELDAFTPPEVQGAMQASKDRYIKEAEIAGKLRTEFAQDSNSFVLIRDSYDRILESAQKPSAAGDLALIFNYMKMLDPTSVVRESEFATAQNAAGVDERTRAWWNRMLKGERLTPKMRADFLQKSGQLYDAAKRGQQQLVNQYKRLSDVNLVDPRRVIIDYTYEMGKPTLPEGVPEGSYLKGTKEGKQIWQGPDGPDDVYIIEE